MNCTNCGSELRPGARFCNVCGTRQAETSPVAPPTPTADEFHEHDGGEVDQGGGRLKRPPRVPRATVATLEGGEAIEDLWPSGHGDLSAQPQGAPSETDLNDSGVAPTTDLIVPDAAGDGALPSDHEHVEGAESSEASATPATNDEQVTPERDLADSETRHATTMAPLPPLETLAKEQPEDAGPDAPRWSPEGLSWPLPLNIIKGGRYRVEAVVAATDDQQFGENVYRVRDLQGYERCWSCGMEYDASSSGNTFCQQCGADLLGRPYLMYERKVHADEPFSGELTPETGVAAEERRFVEARRSYRVIPDAPVATPFPRGSRFVVGIGADVGATRPGEQSEDSQAVLTVALGLDSRVVPAALAVVADGLGGHASGQEASELVVRSLVSHVAQRLVQPLINGELAHDAQAEYFTALLSEGVRSANISLCRRNEEREADMGSTLVAVLVVGDVAYVANAGDSRAYVFEHGDLRRITTDHSLVEQLVAGGLIQSEDRYTHPQRNQIFKSLGDEPNLQPDTFIERLTPGTRIVLCSDGLWEMVRDDEIARVLAEQGDVQAACDDLVRRANANGGEDNISVVLLEARA